MADWQDISTAPKDGTHVLIFLPADSAGGAEQLLAVWTQSGWESGDCLLHHDAPTHWHPIPAPPGTDRPTASEQPQEYSADYLAGWLARQARCRCSVEVWNAEKQAFEPEHAALRERLLQHVERGHMINGDEPFDWWLSTAQQLLREAAAALER